ERPGRGARVRRRAEEEVALRARTPVAARLPLHFASARPIPYGESPPARYPPRTLRATNRDMTRSIVGAALLLAACSASRPGVDVAPTDPAHLHLQRLSATSAEHEGRPAVRLSPADPDVDVEGLAILDGSDFGDGTLELDLAGAPSEGHPASRGFIG